MFTVNETASQNGEEFGFQSGDIVQEWLWDDDVDDSLRAKIEDLTGEDLVDEDYDSAVDGAIVWWRDGDDEDELSDTIVDAYSVVGDDGPFWVLTPKPGRTGAASSSTVQSAAKTAGMNAATPLTVSPDWNGIRLRAFGKDADPACPPARYQWTISTAASCMPPHPTYGIRGIMHAATTANMPGARTAAHGMSRAHREAGPANQRCATDCLSISVQ